MGTMEDQENEEGWGEEGDEGWGDGDAAPAELDEKTQIENMFVEAEFVMETNPEESLNLFQTVMQMESQLQEECNYEFKACKNIIVIHAKRNEMTEVMSKTRTLLKLCNKVSPNDSRDAVSYVLDQLSRNFKPEEMEAVYEDVMKVLRTSNEKLWQSVCIRLCRIYLEKKKFKQLGELAEQLKSSMRGADGNYDEVKGNPFEVLALQMQMLAEMKEIKKLKVLHSEALNLSGVVTDARVNAMLKECGAIIYMNEKNWEKAQTELLESFKSYQQMANPKGKLMLKLLIVISMVGGSEINPMTISEAKVFNDDPDIAPLAGLRNAYENNQISQLKSLMMSKGKKLSEDKDLKEFSGEFFKAIKQKILMEKIMSYTNVSLKFLAHDLDVTETEVKALLVELILDEKVEGKIDESKGCLEVRAAERDPLEMRRYVSLERMANSMSSMFTGIIDSICA
eukprot:TRINITY_DN382_c0_g1_i4.p1 TRINITY_DN382_c0_g1~~TRINITY_DN382_c0_g1_i4.p1  ORF type:complete len:453 (-),score=102.47 TRINITY_DN382_c0_g1_i4:42-1400(-)